MIKNYLLKILDIDSDGNTTAKIIDKKLRNTEVFIPHNKQNPVIKIGDTVSSLIKYKKKSIINTKILKKIYAPKPFFAQVNETHRNARNSCVSFLQCASILAQLEHRRIS